jgi:hypothetical protein
MTTIYDNPEYAQSGYSGTLQYEFQHKGFRFSINKGSTNSGGKPSAKAYHISVYMGESIPLFDMYAYEYEYPYALVVSRGMLYKFLETKANEVEQIANFIFATACQHTNTVNLFKNALDTVYLSALKEGRTEVQVAICKELGIPYRV